MIRAVKPVLPYIAGLRLCLLQRSLVGRGGCRRTTVGSYTATAGSGCHVDRTDPAVFQDANVGIGGWLIELHG